MGSYSSIFDNPVSRVSIGIGVALVVVTFVLLMLLFFQSMSLRLRRPNVPDPPCCGGNDPQSNSRLKWISVTYQTGTSASSSSAAFGCDGCPICLGYYCAGEGAVVLLRCKHMFHEDCIKRWVPERSSRCPVCREQVFDAAPSGTGPTLPLNFVSTGIMSHQLGLN